MIRKELQIGKRSPLILGNLSGLADNFFYAMGYSLILGEGGIQLAVELKGKDAKCIGGVCDPQRTQGLRAPTPKGNHVLVSLKGPGVFVSALMTKQGGATGLTFASLDIDGRNVINISYAAAENWGLAGQNPWGVVFLKSTDVNALAMGFPMPLYFKSELKLSALVNEDGVVQIIGNVIHGK